MDKLPFVLEGCVVPGKQLGSTLGFPTANIAYDPQERAWPREGVYVAVARLDGDSRCYAAVLNQGRHPTAPGGAPTVEAHLLDFPAQPLYGRRLMLHYCAFLRSEQRFSSLEVLRRQLSDDRKQAIEWIRENRPDLLPSTNV